MLAFKLNSFARIFKIILAIIAFLPRTFPAVGWGTDQLAGFGEERGAKHQIINLIHSVRTVMRSKLLSI